MARGKVQMRRIQNPVHRQITFGKRLAGLLKKAKELSVLCDADIGIVVFSSHGKCYELATRGTMHEMIERYMKSSGSPPCCATEDVKVSESQDIVKEISALKQEIQLLQKGLRYIFGEGVGNMTLDELQALERYLENWMYHIRSEKMQIMSQEIQLLKNKESILKAENEMLQDKIIEQNIMQIVERNGFFNMDPVLPEIPYPLTKERDISVSGMSELN